MSYNGTTEVISGFKKANNRDFALAKTHDIWADEPDKRLDEVINDIIDGDGGSLRTKADKANTVLDTYLSRGRLDGSQIGTNSFAFGDDVVAEGAYSHAEGGGYSESSGDEVEEFILSATGNYSHAEGQGTQAVGDGSHAEGQKSRTYEDAAHAEGFNTQASGVASHAEGNTTIAQGAAAHAEGSVYGYNADGQTLQAVPTANGIASHVEGQGTTAIGNASHAEGRLTTASGDVSHVEGSWSKAVGDISHAEGFSSAAYGANSHAEGTSTETGAENDSSKGASAHAEGENTHATANYSHAEGYNTSSVGEASHTEGRSTRAEGVGAHAEGIETKATGPAAHAEGDNTTASKTGAHAEGEHTNAFGYYSHAEGMYTNANDSAHAEGQGTSANGVASHAEGMYTIAAAESSHVGGVYNVEDSYASWPEFSSNTYYPVGAKMKYTQHTSGGMVSTGYICKIAHTSGNSIATPYWTEWGDFGQKMNFAEIIGNGTDASHKANARALGWDGNEYLAGDVYVKCDSSSANGKKLATEESVQNADALKADKADTTLDTYLVVTDYLSRGRKANTDIGGASFAFGTNVEATKLNSHAEGSNTHATATQAHAEGYKSTASGSNSHAEGNNTVASGAASHAEGAEFVDDRNPMQVKTYQNKAAGDASHAEGQGNTVNGQAAHGEGIENSATGLASHVEGFTSRAAGEYSHAEGYSTTATGNNSHAEGSGTIAAGENQHVEGKNNVSSETMLHIIGNGVTTSSRSNAFAIDANGNGYFKGDAYVNCDATSANGNKVATEGYVSDGYALKTNTVLETYLSHGRKDDTTAGSGSIAFGYNVTASNSNSQAFGDGTTASASAAHAEGYGSTASGIASHAEGWTSTASGIASHAEGLRTTASNRASHAEGADTTASGTNSHAEGNATTASGNDSHAEGTGTITGADNQHVEGMYNVVKRSFLHIVGNGTADNARSNAFALSDTGTGYYNGDLYVNCSANSTGGNKVATEGYVSTSYAPLASPALTGTPTAPTAANGTNTTQIATTAFVMNAFTANDAMVFKGTLGTGGTVTSLPATHQVGWSYKVITAETYAGQKCEIGDLVICIGTAGTNADWVVVQSNLDGAVTGPASATVGHVAAFNNTNGKIIKDSGYTIQASVPPNAVFTDTTYENLPAAEDGTDVSLVTTGEKNYWDNKADATDTVLYTSLSRGRKDGTTTGTNSFAFGNSVTASASYSHAEGNLTIAAGTFSHAEGYNSTASGNESHAEGYNTVASSLASHAEGSNVSATGIAAHAEGYYTLAKGMYSHAEGSVYTDPSSGLRYSLIASGNSSHAEGQATMASGDVSHAEGCSTTAAGYASHAEGQNTTANADCSHVSGTYNVGDSYTNWPEYQVGTFYEVGAKVKVTGYSQQGAVVTGYICNTAHVNDQTFDTTKWDPWDKKMNYVEIVGNGTDASHKSNARALGWDGNEYLAGDIYVNCDSNSTNGKKLATEEYVNTHSSIEAITNAEIDALFD